MELRALVVSLLCVAHALDALPSERIADLPQGKIDDKADGQPTEKSRDKRALGLLLSGLAQIFGYTVTPIQLASLPNPNATGPAAMPNTSMTMGMMPSMMGMMPNMTGMMPNMTGMKPQQAAASQPANATTPRRQETIRFTGVVNFGNNSDIIGHLQRYEQIFHGRGSNATMMSTMPMPPMPMPPMPMPPMPMPPMPMPPMPMPPMPMPPAKLSVDLRTNEERPPLLAPFFVKIPLPIAPDLPPATMPIVDLPLSYPAPAISYVNVPDEDAAAPLVAPSVAPSLPQGPPVRKKPVRKEEEMIYRNNENTERYMIQQKEIYDEKDVRKPDKSRYNHQFDESKWKQQQEERYNELQRDQEERVERLKEKEAERSREKNVHYNEDEMNKKYKNREEEIDNRNREQAAKYESEEEERPAYSDERETENSAEEYEEHEDDHARPSGSSAKQSSREDEREKAEDYPSYDDGDDGDEPKKQPHKQPENFDKYIIVGYNQLPIGDYFHKDSPEVIRDSYGEVLDNKKLEEDRLADYVNMFKQPYFDTQNIDNPEDAREDEKATPVSGYDEHLVRVQKLREEYGPPENKYEEYEIEGEGDANSDEESERVQNYAPVKQRGPTTDHRGKEDDDARSEKSQDEIDFVRYVPLVVPVRYVDVNDKTQQASTRQLNYKESDKRNLANSEPVDDNVSVPTRSKVTPQIGLPERPRQLHEVEVEKQLRLWPPPFDYVFDTTESVSTVVSPNHANYYQPAVKPVVVNDASNDNSVEQPSGYLVVVGDPNHRYPYNVYYFPNGAVDPQNRDLYSNIEDAQNQVYIPQQSVNQQLVQQSNPNFTKYNLNETARSTQNYYHQSREVPVNILGGYEYVSGYTPRAEESSNVENIRSQIADINNWSSKIHEARGDTDERQNVASSSQNARKISSENNIQLSRRRRSSQQDDDRGKNQDKKEEATQPPIPENKPFDDPESAHDFFGFNKDDYSFEGESSDASEVEEKDDKTATVVPEPIAYRHDDESMMSDELENDPEKAEVTEYRNKVATLKVSEQRQSQPNGPIQYEKREEIQRRNELENKMTEILENLKTRLLVE